MTYDDIRGRVLVFGFSDDELIHSAMRTIYNGSTLAAIAVNAWLAANPSQNIIISFTSNNAFAGLGTGNISIDPVWIANNLYISSTGQAVADTLVSGLAHELGHAITDFRDNDRFSNLKGDNITNVNPWFDQLGIPLQASYEAYDVSGVILDNGFNYTQGEFVENAIIDVGPYDNTPRGGVAFNSSNIDLAANNISGPSLIVGGLRDNNYAGTTGRDHIYGKGGDDVLEGRGGNDQIFGGEDDDTIDGGDGSDILFGENGQDVVSGGAERDELYGGAGDDQLQGGSGMSVVR